MRNEMTVDVIGSTVVSGSIAGAAGFLAWLDLPAHPLYVLGCVMLIDLVTGVIASHRCGKPFASKIFRSGLWDKLHLLLVSCSVILLTRVVGLESEAFMVAMIYLLCGSEVYSSVSNYVNAKRGIPLPEWDVWTLIGKAIVAAFKQPR